MLYSVMVDTGYRVWYAVRGRNSGTAYAALDAAESLACDPIEARAQTASLSVMERVRQLQAARGIYVVEHASPLPNARVSVSGLSPYVKVRRLAPADFKDIPAPLEN